MLRSAWTCQLLQVPVSLCMPLPLGLLRLKLSLPALSQPARAVVALLLLLALTGMALLWLQPGLLARRQVARRSVVVTVLSTW